MIKNNVIAIIPARGGSKGIPKKNIKLLLGSPLIAYTIELAKKMDAITVGITAFDDGRLKNMVYLLVHAPTDQGDYGPAEDVHMMLDHLISNYLMDAIDIE